MMPCRVPYKSTRRPVFTKDVIKRIKTGNFTDDMKRLADVDWIIEVVVENLDVKKSVFTRWSNSGSPGPSSPQHLRHSDPPHDGRPQRDFQEPLLRWGGGGGGGGTHFFNPPRYLRLLEIIPTPHTDPAVIDFSYALRRSFPRQNNCAV